MSYEPIRSGQVIDNINTFLEVDDIPYYLTKYAHRNGNIIAFPQMIRRDSEVLHGDCNPAGLGIITVLGI